MSTANHTEDDVLALFALQLLSQDEQDTVVAHLEGCEPCRITVAELQGDLVAYAMTAEMHSPPAAARERLLRQVAKEKKPVPLSFEPPASTEPMLSSRNSSLFADIIEEPAPRRGFAWLGWVGLAAAIGLGILAGFEFRQSHRLQEKVNALSTRLAALAGDQQAARAEAALDTLTSADAQLLNLRTPLPAGARAAKPAPEGHVAYVADKGAMVFFADHLDPLPQYKTYELWALPSNGHDPVSAGTFKPDAHGSANVLLPDLPAGIPIGGFGVTVEDDGGSSAPTKPIILVGMF